MKRKVSSFAFPEDFRKKSEVGNKALEQKEKHKTEDENSKRLSKPELEDISNQAHTESDEIDSAENCLYEIIEYYFYFYLKETRNNQIYKSKHL